MGIPRNDGDGTWEPLEEPQKMQDENADALMAHDVAGKHEGNEGSAVGDMQAEPGVVKKELTDTGAVTVTSRHPCMALNEKT